jgi:hypothetical protein
MTTSRPRDAITAERLASTIGTAARAHERALLVELWAAEYFQRRGDMRAARRHQDAGEREARFAQSCYDRLASSLHA